MVSINKRKMRKKNYKFKDKAIKRIKRLTSIERKNKRKSYTKI